MYIANDVAFQRGRFVKSNALKNFYFGLPLVGLINFLAYESHSTNEGAVIFFCAILPVEVIFYLAFMFWTVRMIKRWNRTIKTIEIQNGQISISTFDVLWLKPKVYSESVSEVGLRQSAFEWYEKNRSEGWLVKIDTDDELYLVKDYFDDCIDLIALLKVS